MRDELHLGTVKFFDAQKNKFGFITNVKSFSYEYEEDIFVSERDLKCPSSKLTDGRLVYFKVEETSKGYKAVDLDIWENLPTSEKIRLVDLMPSKRKEDLAEFIISNSVDLSEEKTSQFVNLFNERLPSNNHYVYEFLLKYGDESVKEKVFEDLDSLTLFDKNDILFKLSKTEPLVRNFVLKSFQLKLKKHLNKYSEILCTGDFEEKYLRKLLDTDYDLNILPADHLLHYMERSGDEENLLKIISSNRFLSNNVENVVQKVFSKKDIGLSFFEKIIRSKNFYSFTPKLKLAERLLASSSYDKERVISIVSNQLTHHLNLNSLQEYQEADNRLQNLLQSIENDLIKESLNKKFEELFYSKFEEWRINDRIQFILNNIENSEKLDIEPIIREEERLVLWIEGHINGSNDLKPTLLPELPNYYQQLFIKRLFYENKSKPADDILEPLNKLLDFCKDNDKAIDFSTEIVITSLNEINKGESDFRKNIYQILFERIDDLDPQDQNIMGYFDRCAGRAILNQKNDDEYEIKRLDKYPCTFCEGSLFIDYETKKPIKEKKSGKSFWLCRNSRCMKSNRDDIEKEDWKSYTLKTLTSILDLNFSDRDYANFLGVLNRVDYLLPHLFCKECGKGLTPTKSYYGYYRSSKFRCKNESCSVHKDNEIIYLTHCINNKCYDIIDSRESPKCNHNGYSEMHGWYVCNNCLACCTTEKIENRINIYKQSNRDYYGPLKGHKDRGIICCNECGNHMEFKDRKYQEVLDRLIEIKDSVRVVKYGKRNDGGWWFLIKKLKKEAQNEFINRIRDVEKRGFNVPDLPEEKNIYLVAEPYTRPGTVLVCTNESCYNILDIGDLARNNEYERLKSLEWHEGISKINAFA